VQLESNHNKNPPPGGGGGCKSGRDLKTDAMFFS